MLSRHRNHRNEPPPLPTTNTPSVGRNRITSQEYFSQHFIPSFSIFNSNPLSLAIIHLILAIFIFTTLLTTIGLQLHAHQTSAPSTSLLFFTILTYWGLGFYFLTSFIHGFFLSFSPSTDDTDSLSSRCLRYAHSMFYCSVVVFPFIVTVVFWAVLARGTDVLYDEYATWQNVSLHALNSVFAFFEIVATSTRLLPWMGIVCLIVLEGLYLALTYLGHSIRGGYVYPFLDPGRVGSGIVAAACVGIVVATVVVFCIVRGVMWARIQITEGREGVNRREIARLGMARRDMVRQGK